MSEVELIKRILELANDPVRRTVIAQKAVSVGIQPSLQPLAPPATGSAVQDAEEQMGFAVPPLLAKLWTEVANGGFGPGYGLFGIENGGGSELSMSIPNLYFQSIEDASADWPKRLVLICEWGCGYFSAIDCSTPEGKVVNLVEDPERVATGLTFAEWMEDWVNGVDLWERDFGRLGLDPSGAATVR